MLTIESQASLAAVMAFTLSPYLSKIAVLAFLARVTAHRRQVWRYRVCLASFAVLGLIPSCLSQSAGHSTMIITGPLRVLRKHTICRRLDGRLSPPIDIVIEIVLLILPNYMAWDLQMPLRNKVLVVGAFYLRVPLVGLSAGRFVHTKRLCTDGVDLGLDSAIVLIWLCMEASFALLVSHFLALRSFALSFNSNFGQGFVTQAGPESYSMQRTGNKSGGNATGNGSGSGSGRGLWSRRGGGSKQSPSNGSQNAVVNERPPILNQTPMCVDNKANCLASPGLGNGHDWQEDGSSGRTTMEEMVIVREQGYTVPFEIHLKNRTVTILSKPLLCRCKDQCHDGFRRRYHVGRDFGRLGRSCLATTADVGYSAERKQIDVWLAMILHMFDALIVMTD